MKKFLVILGILTSINIFAADIVKNNIPTETDKIGMFVQNSNAYFALQTKTGATVTFGLPKSVLINTFKDGSPRYQIPGIIANANNPEESALQFYHIQYDKKQGILILDFAGTEDYIVFNKDEVLNFGKILEHGGV
ncbi:hypothetical protein [uncultured Cetobacterium sp.]|uniref:hypothetical protein n=1 Tax=uncultured Cetobacterium sp. TaxID=527638 RepID=UPI00260F9276|nr:hypothetical protein [uncultured Cetobacterium sp.]